MDLQAELNKRAGVGHQYNSRHRIRAIDVNHSSSQGEWDLSWDEKDSDRLSGVNYMQMYRNSNSVCSKNHTQN